MTVEQLIEDFAFLDSWEDRYGYILELGKSLAPLTDDERNETTHVKGCVSQVWLVTERDGNQLSWRGDSDSAIVRGLIAVLLTIFSGKSTEEIRNIDPQPIMAKLGLDQHLTPQRANGLVAMINRIKAEAAA